MMDGTDAVSDWPLLNALLNTAGGATWVSLHHGGGVGMGYSQHSRRGDRGRRHRSRRQTPGARAGQRQRFSGVMRHADAGYETRDCLRQTQWHLQLPMIE